MLLRNRLRAGTGHVAGPDCEISAFRHGVAGVDRQVHQHVLERVHVGIGAPQSAGQHRLDRDVFGQAAAEDLFHPDEQAVDLDRLRRQGLLTREGEQAPREIRGTLRTLHGAVYELPDLVIAAREPPLHEVEAADDDGQHVIEVVRDPARELAERLEALHVAELRLAFLAACHLRPELLVRVHQLRRARAHLLFQRCVELRQVAAPVVELVRDFGERSAELVHLVHGAGRGIDDLAVADCVGEGAELPHDADQVAGDEIAAQESEGDQPCAEQDEIVKLILQRLLQQRLGHANRHRPAAHRGDRDGRKHRNAFERDRVGCQRPLRLHRLLQVGYELASGVNLVLVRADELRSALIDDGDDPILGHAGMCEDAGEIARLHDGVERPGDLVPDQHGHDHAGEAMAVRRTVDRRHVRAAHGHGGGNRGPDRSGVGIAEILRGAQPYPAFRVGQLELAGRLRRDRAQPVFQQLEVARVDARQAAERGKHGYHRRELRIDRARDGPRALLELQGDAAPLALGIPVEEDAAEDERGNGPDRDDRQKHGAKRNAPSRSGAGDHRGNSSGTEYEQRKRSFGSVREFMCAMRRD